MRIMKRDITIIILSVISAISVMYSIQMRMDVASMKERLEKNEEALGKVVDFLNAAYRNQATAKP